LLPSDGEQLVFGGHEQGAVEGLHGFLQIVLAEPEADLRDLAVVDAMELEVPVVASDEVGVVGIGRLGRLDFDRLDAGGLGLGRRRSRRRNLLGGFVASDESQQDPRKKAHVSIHYDNCHSFLPPSLAGLPLGLFRGRDGSLHPRVVLHAA